MPPEQSFYKKFLPAFYTIAGSFIMVAGWNWYHLARRPHARFIVISLVMWLGLALGYRLALFLYDKLLPRFRRHPFWHTEFRAALDQLFFLSALLFGVFFIPVELASLLYVFGLLVVLFFVVRRRLARHPAARPWLAVHRAVGILAGVLFATQALAQYISYRWYILDTEARFYNIVLFRSWAMTALWLLGFAVAGVVYARYSGLKRSALLTLWSVCFIAVLFFWSVNLGTLYYSGLHFSPSAWEHLRDSDELIASRSTLAPIFGFIIFAAAFFAALLHLVRTHRSVPPRHWYSYYGAVAGVAIISLLSFSSLKSTPERLVIESFYQYYYGPNTPTTIDPIILAKLKSFGLDYRPDTFYIAEHDRVFSTSSPSNLLPKKFKTQPPNIIIVFLESGSARLTSVYSDRFPELTPGLAKMAANQDTTVFKNFYNASTPTVTGLLSLLCSFLPPTGHEEIQTAKKLHRHRLFCLPEVLHRNGFAYSAYITAVKKNFANKDGIFESMGTKEVYGTAELKPHITAAPLSWGYSDHQLFPFTWQLAKRSPQPFLLMLSTVDTHPPFNLAKDEVPYGDGKNQVLNAFHTTDDAFSAWWDQFKASPLAANTIVVAVADHAVFPGAYDKKTFPTEAGQLNFYDANVFLMYLPSSTLPRVVTTTASGLDFTPTLLHILGYTERNSFEGHSIFDDRSKYPGLLGMHELGLYINQFTNSGKREALYNVPSRIECPPDYDPSQTKTLTLCDYWQFYRWKRTMFEEGRFWKR